MRTRQRWISVAALLFAAVAMPAWAGDKPASGYGEIVRYSKKREIKFPDFTMRYLGERHVDHPVFKPGFTYYDFEVRGAKGMQTVSWSSGTGVIDSASFMVDSRPYELELRGSVMKKGWLGDDEMVVWPQKQFLKALEKRNKAAR